MLILDGHVSHFNWEFFDYCLNAKIIPLCLPTHSTHLVPPLEVGLFSPLQRHYSNGLHEFIRKGHAGMNKGESLPYVVYQLAYRLLLVNHKLYRILMPARRLTFTPKNIMSAWKAMGIIYYNLWQVLGGVKRKQENVSHSKTSAMPPPAIPKTPRAVSRVTRTAFSIVTRKTPSSLKLKALLSGLSEGFQQTIADKVVEEEAHHQYPQLVGKDKKGKTSDHRKLTEATVVTSETVIPLWDERERVDAARAARKAKKLSPSLRPGHKIQTGRTPEAAEAAEIAESEDGLRDTDVSMGINEAEDLWEEMEALEVSGDILGAVSGGGVADKIQVRGKW